jgi:hypothetical protein
MLRGLDALGRFLLEGVKNPDFVANLRGVDDAKRVPTERQRNLKDAGANALERFGNVGLAVLCRNRQSGKADGLCVGGKLLELLMGALDPRDGPRLSAIPTRV